VLAARRRRLPPTATTCLYTITPDHDFVVGRDGPVTVLAGFSGHGFKFASAIGALAAGEDVALQGVPPCGSAAPPPADHAFTGRPDTIIASDC